MPSPFAMPRQEGHRSHAEESRSTKFRSLEEQFNSASNLAGKLFEVPIGR